MVRKGLWALAFAVLVPTSASAVGNDTVMVPATSCVVGNESLTYDQGVSAFDYSGMLACANTYTSLKLKVKATTVDRRGHPIVSLSETVACTDCSSLLRQGSRSALPSGLITVWTEATVGYADGAAYRASHNSCFWVTPNSATLVARGCTA